MNVGDISLKLTLDGKDFNITVKDAGRLLREFQQTSEQTAKSVRRLEDAHGSLATKFRHLVLTLGNLRFALLDIYDVFLRLPGQVLQTAGELERMQKLMEGLSTRATKSAREIEAATSFDYLINMARNAPFQLSALSESFVKLKSGGIDPTNGSMQALVDSVARFGGSSDSLKRASVAIQQMAGKGVISMEELRQQLGEAVPDAMKAMAIGTGTSMAQLAKLVSDGVVEANSAISQMLTVLALKNQGSAKEMLNTFLGALDQLKTEWQVVSKEIGDAGFTKEVVAVIKEVTESLKSNDFRRFAKDFGAALGDTVKMFADLARTAIEYKDVIISLVEAFVLYKVATSVIQPNLLGVASAFKNVGQSASDVRSNLLATALTQRETTMQELRNAQERANASRMASQAAILAKEQELAAITAANAKLKVEAAQVQAAMNPTVPAPIVNKPGIFTLIDPKRLRELELLNSAIEENNRKLRTGQQEVLGHKAASDAAALAAAAHATQMQQLGTKIEGVSRASVALGVAQRALGGLWNLMGGWLGALNIVLTAGIALWFSYANAVREADSRLRRLKQNASSEEDIKEFEKTISGISDRRKIQQTAIDQLQRNVDRATDPTAKAAAQRRLDAAKEEMRRINSEMVQAESNLAAARQSMVEQNANDEAAVYTRAFDKQKKVVEDGYKQRIDSESAKFRELEKAASGNQKQLKKIAEEEASFLKKIGQERAVELEKVIRAEIMVQQRRRDLSAEARGKNIDFLQQQLEQVQRDAKNASELGKIVLSKPDKKEGPTKTPIETFIENLKEQRAELFNEIQQLSEGTARLSEVEKALAGFKGRMTGGDGFKYEVKDKSFGPTDAQSKEAEQLVREVAAFKQLVADAEKIATEARRIGPDYAEALETIANPLGNVETRRTNRIDEMKAQLSNLRQILEEAKLSEPAAKVVVAMINNIEGALAGATSRAGTIDAASAIKRIAAENQKLTGELVTEDRERAREQNRLSNEKADAEIANLRQVLQNVEMTAAQREQVEALLAKNQALRAAKTTELQKTPMQKMLDEWRNTTKAMEDLTVKWTNGAIDAFVNFARTGKLEFGDLVESMLADLLKLKLQQSMGAGLDALFTAGLGWLKGFGFANGGVMTGAGAMSLRKYAAGGIANSPQLALFGEGSTPEAYVPLPDGRTIPVTMSGSGGWSGGDVIVNVINQTSTPVTATKGSPRFDGRQMILDVVLGAASQPGPFRDGLQTMMKK